MIIGIDVGGTHTDGVLIDQNHVLKTCKVITNPDQLESSLLQALDQLLQDQPVQKIQRIVLSTTLATNLIAQKNYPPTGLIVIPGPGLSTQWLEMGSQTWRVSGAVDHRGRITGSLKEGELEEIVSDLRRTTINNLAIVGKFSTRNPGLEEKVATYIREQLPHIKNIQLGNRVAPQLNFPRRVHTTWLNTAVYQQYTSFVNSVQRSVKKRGLSADLYLLKADGGTMPLSEKLNAGVETIHSGPAASIMGSLALSQTDPLVFSAPVLLMDVGGTTTDMALLIDHLPLFEPAGITIERYQTSVRGLLNRSLPYGGDSLIYFQHGEPKLKSHRLGPAAAFGGSAATLTDALVLLGRLDEGNHKASQQAFQNLIDRADTKTSSIEQTARKVVTHFEELVQNAVQQLLEELNNQPVYTIHELLENQEIEPQILMMIGGPAKALLSGLASVLELQPFLPAYHQVVNALGAAAARLTLTETLYADTAQKYYRISNTQGKEKITGTFGLAEARKILMIETEKKAQSFDGSLEETSSDLIEITREEIFQIVRNFYTQGQIMKLTAQIRPGIQTPIHLDNKIESGGDF